MKLLIIYPTLTHPIDAGNKQWVMLQVEEFRKLGHEVFMLCINAPKSNKDLHQNKLERAITEEYWKEYGFIYDVTFWEKQKLSLYDKIRRRFFHSYYKCDDFYPTGLTNYVKGLQEKYHFDACIVNYYWLTKVFKKVSFRLTAVNTHDVFAYKDQSVAKDLWMCTNPNEEAKGIQRANCVFALQDEESAYFQRIAPKVSIYNVYCPYSINPQKLTYNHNLVILAGANKLNIEGFDWFCEYIYPKLIHEFPDINLIVGGYICKKLSAYSEKEHIKLIGVVDNPADLYRFGDVAINPCINGTGLKIKTFEALSYGKIAMTHPHSTIGIYKKESAPVFNSIYAEEWVYFLKKIWGDKEKLALASQKSLKYIKDMNNNIKAQYVSFLNSASTIQKSY